MSLGFFRGVRALKTPDRVRLGGNQWNSQLTDGIVNAYGHALLCFESPFRDPLGDILLVICGVLGAHIRIGDDEALNLDTLAN